MEPIYRAREAFYNHYASLVNILGSDVENLLPELIAQRVLTLNDKVIIEKTVMHLSLSSPRYPRSGSGGDEWGFAIVGLQIPHPWGQLYVANPHHCQYGQVFLYV